MSYLIRSYLAALVAILAAMGLVFMPLPITNVMLAVIYLLIITALAFALYFVIKSAEDDYRGKH